MNNTTQQEGKLKTTKKYYDTFCGHKVSQYGLDHGRLDYATLSKCFDAVLCNSIMEQHPEAWDYLESGDLSDYYDKDGNEITREEYDELIEKGEEADEVQVDIFQYFIVSSNAIDLLKEAGEIVFYCEALDVYIWGVTHLGTSWDYVLTSIKLEERK